MTDESSSSVDSNECLEELNQVKKIAENFRKQNFGLTTRDSEILFKLETSLMKCLDSSWEIDSIFEDEEISPFEFDQLSLQVNQIDQIVQELSKKHEENIAVVNKIIHFFNATEGLVEGVEYVSDVYRTPLGASTHKTEYKQGYLIDEASFNRSIKQLNELLVIKKSTEASSKISKIEREIICLSKIYGAIKDDIVFNIIYIKPTQLIKALRTSYEIIEATILPIHHLINESYFIEKIHSAKEGLSKIAESEDFDIGETISIRGLFNRKKGIKEIEELSNTLRSI